uniref:LAGLIDADG homing endonuclease n=1 Tax=Auxenochlorella protothecoides TaxID=3075 RepID=A0A1Z1GBK1_AUXPR|nr:LAGLIDADG homing endonuclease [Auxenochlorella protothecoides]
MNKEKDKKEGYYQIKTIDKPSRAIITQRVHSIIFGSLLGDGHCRPTGNLAFGFGPKNEEYARWLAKELESVRSTTPVAKRAYTDKRNMKIYESYTFETYRLFHDYRRLFYVPHIESGEVDGIGNPYLVPTDLYKYQEGEEEFPHIIDSDGVRKKIYFVKRVPLSLKKKLDVLALAIWYMDDGGRSGGGTKNCVFITLDGFTWEEGDFIQSVIKDNFGIDGRHNKAGFSTRSRRRQHRLTIPFKEYPKFYELLYPIVSQIPSMMKKLPPVTPRKILEPKPIKRSKKIILPISPEE